MLLRRQVNDLVFYTSPLLDRAGVAHAFSTRLGGVSPAPFDSLNLGIARDSALKDDAAHVEDNYRRLAGALGLADRQRCWVSQVHEADLCLVRPGETFKNGPRADALMTDDPARLLSIKYADCVPILLATAEGRVVAAVHAGWRGIVAEIIPTVVARMAEISVTRPDTFIAVVGPCISLDHFEVGAEVSAEFRRIFGNDAPIRQESGGKDHVDLARAVALQLERAGIPTDRIDVAWQCTYANQREFFSHRRDGAATGRMAALIAPTTHPAGAGA